MIGEKFTLMQYPVHAILGLIDAGQFVIPEIQRPFVWKRKQVRDLIDSLYNGYPTGYIITWKNPDVKTKDGTIAGGKHVLIDGQQRITALMAAISGLSVLDQDFNQDRIRIAFNPLATDPTKRFEVQDASHLKDKKWIPDISVLFKPDFRQRAFENQYADCNEDVDLDEVSEELTKLKSIANRQIGVIELDHTLEINEVTEIFIRINSKGTPLSQSDFVMSKMASDTTHNGNMLRKVVDYFCHLAVKPNFYAQMQKDADFAATPYAAKMQWQTVTKIFIRLIMEICCELLSCTALAEENCQIWSVCFRDVILKRENLKMRLLQTLIRSWKRAFLPLSMRIIMSSFFLQ